MTDAHPRSLGEKVKLAEELIEVLYKFFADKNVTAGDSVSVLVKALGYTVTDLVAKENIEPFLETFPNSVANEIRTMAALKSFIGDIYEGRKQESDVKNFIDDLIKTRADQNAKGEDRS